MNSKKLTLQYEIGDVVCLNIMAQPVKIKEYLRNRNDQSYNFIWITPPEGKEELISAPISLAGYQSRIQNIIKKNNNIFVVTAYLTISVNKAIKSEELSITKGEIYLTKNDISQYEFAISEIKECTVNLLNHNVVHRNNVILNALDYLYFGYLKRSNSRIREEIEKNKLKFETITDEFIYSWEAAIKYFQSKIDEIGFLYDLSNVDIEGSQKMIEFIIEAQERQYDRYLNFEIARLGLFLTRSTKKVGRCTNSKIINIYCSNIFPLQPLALDLNGQYYFVIEILERQNTINKLITINPWKNKLFIDTIEKFKTEETN